MICEQMLKFALGRDLEYYDEPEVKRITEAVIRDDYSALTMVNGIVSSYPFRFRSGVTKTIGESE